MTSRAKTGAYLVQRNLAVQRGKRVRQLEAALGELIEDVKKALPWIESWDDARVLRRKMLRAGRALNGASDAD